MTTPQMANPAGGRGSAKTNIVRLHTHGSPIDNLLQRLDKVRKAGKGWTARCPAHEVLQ